MGADNHKDRAHALLSASGASRWLNCTPSARIEEGFKESGSSIFAEEGTLAHEFGDLALQKAIDKITQRQYRDKVNKHKKHKLYSPEMDGEVEKYTSFVLEQYTEALKRTPDAVLLVEEKVSLEAFISEGFGTCDAIIIADGIMDVIDLKYGKGLKVDADDNSQLKLYGLGALDLFEMIYDIETVRLNIVQPRLDHISTWEISAKDLTNWGEAIVKPKAAEAFEGKGVQNAGDWCRWCKAKPRCATIASQSLKVAKHEFKSPHLLTDTQLLEVYGKQPMVADWIKSVAEYLLSEAIKGKKWQGLKLVEGKSNRKWKDEGEVKEVLSEYDESKYINAKLKGIGDITKLVGKDNFNELLGALVVKPQGKPTLTDEADKRPAFGIEQAKNDFK